MKEKPKNKIYWTEGVTREEVENALSANKYPMLYQRWVRRALVLISLALSSLLFLSETIGSAKVQSYVAAIAGMLLLLTYFALRLSVRLIADAPSELLDERLAAIRDRTYLTAYRCLSLVVGLSLVAAMVGGLSFGSEPPWPVFFGIAMLVGSLPSMVLAWTLPSEEP